jgi:hypothetical protein
MACQLAVWNCEHTDRLEHCDEAEIALPADRCRVLDPFIEVGERLRAAALKGRHDVTMDHQRPSEEVRACKRARLRPGGPGSWRAGMVPPHRCGIGDRGT